MSPFDRMSDMTKMAKKFLILGVLFFLTSPVLAAMCYVEEKSNSCVYINGILVYAKKVIDDCGHIEARCGSTRVCYSTDLMPFECHLFRRDEKEIFQSEEVSLFSANFFQDLIGIFRSRTQKEFAMKRLNKDQGLDGFPNGDVLFPESGVKFVPRGVDAFSYSSFTLRESGGQGRSLVSLNEGKGEIVVAKSSFVAGKSYQWDLNMRGEVYHGEFSIIGEEDQKDFESDFQELALNRSNSAASVYAMKAYLAGEYGLTFDKERFLDLLKKSINGGA